ncbi:MAG: glycosyltransferase family 4 protein [Acidimicrobiales bacterium]|jgi:glycosyltransferase involved in cell wall biosynthesis
MLVITNWRDRKHPDAGGAELVCERLAQSFAERGFDVVLLAAAVRGESRREQVDGFRIIRRGGRFTVYPWALLWICAHRKQIRGVIDSQNGIPFFTPLAVQRRTPVLMLLHHIHQDQFSLYFSPLMTRVGRWLEKRGSRLVYRHRSIVAVSPSTRAGARGRLGLKGDIVAVAPGCEPIVASLSGRRGRSEHERIVCVGRLVAHKRTALIVRAMPGLLTQFPQLELHLVGDGSERRALEELVDVLDLSDHVVVHGAIGDSERDQLLRTAWMSVNASEGEGWGLSVIEANSVGVPVLAYRRPGLRNSIRHGETGWLIDEDEDLEEAVARSLRTLADESEADSMGMRARQWASQFTWDAMAAQVIALLRAEEGRLAQFPNNRRITTDLATVARVPVGLLPAGLVPAFRGTDKSVMSGDDLVVLLRNTDTDTARTALRRAGVPPLVLSGSDVRVSVATTVDLVSPAIATSPLLLTVVERSQDELAG